MEQCDGKNKIATHNKFAKHLEFYHSFAIFRRVWASTCILRFSIWFVAMYTLRIDVFSFFLCSTHSPLCREHCCFFAHKQACTVRFASCAVCTRVCNILRIKMIKCIEEEMLCHIKRPCRRQNCNFFRLHCILLAGSFLLQIHLSVCE